MERPGARHGVPPRPPQPGRGRVRVGRGVPHRGLHGLIRRGLQVSAAEGNSRARLKQLVLVSESTVAVGLDFRHLLGNGGARFRLLV